MQATFQPAQNTTEPDDIDPDFNATTTNTPTDAPSTDTPAAEDDNTMLYVGLGAAAAVILLVAAVGVVMYRKRGRSVDLTEDEEDALAAMHMQAEVPRDMMVLGSEFEEDDDDGYQLAM